VSADRGDSWQLHEVGQSSLRIAYGDGVFMAWGASWNGSGFDYACRQSFDLGDSWQACPAAITTANTFLHDRQRWIAAHDDGYFESGDAQGWTEHAVGDMPRDLLYDGEAYYGRRGGSVLRSDDLANWREVGSGVADFRSWTVGQVLDRNLPVPGVTACSDNR